MSISPTALARVAGLSAVAAGALFIAVQINHPPLDVAFVGTTEFAIRQSMKIAMTVFALVGITGMYLSQVRKAGVLGLVGYLVFGAGYLAMFSVEVIGLVVLPAIASTSPGYVSDILAAATGGSATGSIGLLGSLNLVAGFGYLLGGLVFGIALARAHVLARWASILLAVATTITMAIPLLPWINQRLFAIPTGVALIALGSSLWRRQRTQVVAETTTDALATALR